MIMLGALALLGGMTQHADDTSIQASTQFWFFLSYIFFSIPGGYLADRLPRKWLMLGCDESRSVILMFAFGMLAAASGPAAVPEQEHWKVYATLFAVGGFAAIFNPTRNAIIPQLMERSQLPAGNAVILVINVVASQIGMVVGGEIISPTAASSVRTGLLLGAAFYFVSGWFFAFLRPHESTEPAPQQRRSLRDAGTYALRHRRVVSLIVINVLTWASAAVVTTAILGLGRVQYGLNGDALLKHFTWVSATLGVGMLIGAAIITLIRTRREMTVVIMTAFGMAGLCVLLLAAVPSMVATYAAALGIGMFGNITIIGVMTMLQSITPNYIRGRIMGLSAMVNNICAVAVYYAIWRLPDADLNIRYVLYLLGPGIMLLGLVGLLRHLRSGPMPKRMTNGLWRIGRLFVFSYHRLRVIGKHRVPAEGPVILAANHTTGLDPFLMQAAVPRTIRWVMLTSYLFRVATPLWRAIEPIALDLDNSDLAKLRKVISVLKDGQIVGLFPEGDLQRTHRELGTFQPGIAMIAQRSGAALVPTWIDGTPRRRNMLWHFLHPSRSTVIFGEPWTPDAGLTHDQVTDELRRRLEALRDQLAAAGTSHDTTPP